MSTATPTPWSVIASYNSKNDFDIVRVRFIGIDRDDELLATVYGDSDAQDGRKLANHIVRCVNSHDTLVEALKTVHSFLMDLVIRPRSSASAQRIGSDAEDSLKAVTAALAKTPTTTPLN